MPQRFDDPAVCADELIGRCDSKISLALPLGLGKAALLANALYDRARKDSTIELSIHTALSLEVPRSGSDLESRFIDPLTARLYTGVPELGYLRDLRRGALPANVRVEEFYFRPGSFLGVESAQQNYVSTNYTHAARDLHARGVNVIAQMVSPGSEGDLFSLSCNPDVTLDLLDTAAASGTPLPLLVGEINPQLPFMLHDAVLPASDFDLLLDSGTRGYPLFPVPNRPVSITDHAIALRVAGLIKDGGTLQIGIGSLGDAITGALILRRKHNNLFRQLISSLHAPDDEVCLDDLAIGLYAASEMFVEGFLHLLDAGVLNRRNEKGVFLDAGFYLGSASFYQRLRDLSDSERNGINMTRIQFTNSLLGDETGKRAQRRDARFVNSAMMMTLMGAAVSDGLEDGRVVSGVGGQYNFVAMAHELAGARSIIALPATRNSGEGISSNIVWNYGHTTIPRHLRDIVVTEYGIADLRGAADQNVIASLLNITDSRFQDSLRRQAVAAGKLPENHRIPERFCNNTSDALTATFKRSAHALPFYPLGTDFTIEEAELAIALAELKEIQPHALQMLLTARVGSKVWHEPRFADALKRMDLLKPSGFRQRFYRALLAGALAESFHDSGRPLQMSGFPEPAD